MSDKNQPAERVNTVSVIIPHYQDLDRLGRCLAALAKQTLMPHEIIIADNGSPCGPEKVKEVVAGRGKVIIAHKRGAGAARNAGVEASSGAILAFTDSDCEPAAQWLASGVKKLGDGDIVGGNMTVSVRDEHQMSGAEAFERVFAFDNRRYIEEEQFSITANLFCHRQTFDSVGPFQVGLSEDIDWCHRAVASGHAIIFSPDAIVSHPAREDWAELVHKWQRLNGELFALQCPDSQNRLRWLLRHLIMPFSSIVHVPKILTSPNLPDARTRRAALGTLVRLRCWRMVNGIALMMRDGRL